MELTDQYVTFSLIVIMMMRMMILFLWCDDVDDDDLINADEEVDDNGCSYDA